MGKVGLRGVPHIVIWMKKMYRLLWFVVLTEIRVRPNRSRCSQTLILFPQGWTKFYEFAFGDLRAGADIIDRLCTAAGKKNIRARYSLVKAESTSLEVAEATWLACYVRLVKTSSPGLFKWPVPHGLLISYTRFAT